MKTIIVDDEELAIRQFEMECKKLPWVNIVGRFHHAQEALEYVEKENLDYRDRIVGAYMPEYSWAEETNARLLM